MRKDGEFSIITNERKCDEKICILHIIRREIMDLKTMQEEFDEKKWLDSVIADEDQCGKYDFCVRCVKAGKYPCAKAMLRHKGRYIRLAIIRRHKEEV